MAYSSVPRARPMPDAARVFAIVAAIFVQFGVFVVLTMPPRVKAPAPDVGDYRIPLVIVRHPFIADPLPGEWRHHVSIPIPGQSTVDPIAMRAPAHPVAVLRRDGLIGTVRTPYIIVGRSHSADPLPRGWPHAVSMPIPGPIPGQYTLEPITMPAPTYPAAALRDGVTGTVLLDLLVGTDGRVLKVRIVRSSGHRVLDEAATDEVLRAWRFRPAVRNNRTVQAVGRVPIIFSLGR